MKIRTLVFDLDGTLLYTLGDLTSSVNHALQTYNCPQKTEAEIASYLGNGIAALVELAVPGGRENPDFDAIFSTFRAYYEEHMADTTRPYDGIGELLQTLHDAGYQLAIVSNKFDAAVKELAEKFFPLIKVAVGESPAVAKKPAPDTVIAALDQLGATAESSLYIGDSEVDIQTAKNSGLPCLSVTWGFRTEEALRRHGGVVFAHTPAEVPALIARFD